MKEDMWTTQHVMRAPFVEKSTVDHRHYRAITLPNKLNVFLISDTTSENAAASMDVAVGHFSDPPNLPGLAHFLEHMLFLGTAKYPDEGSYNNFLAKNGGASNAYTSSENTNYHFKMVLSDKNVNTSDMPKFKEALDRFAQFFTAPLFTESAADRELNAVDSEHQKNLQRDSRRMYQVKKQISNKLHPYSHFGTGSKETLGTLPSENGIDTRAALLEFHKTFYSANLMKLCILGPYSLDVMEDWVAQLFSDIVNHDRAHPRESYSHLQPLLPEHKGKIFYVESIKDIRQVQLSWITPSYREHYKSQPLKYVARLLGDEGEGSIASLLKKKAWCDGIGFGWNELQTFTEVSLTATLTVDGVDHIEEIIEYVYKYIEMMKQSGIERRTFEDCKVVAFNEFRFMERYNPLNFVTNASSHMHLYPAKDYLTGPYLFHEYDPDVIRDVLSYLTPENGNVMVCGKFVSDKVSSEDRWYKTPYHVEDISASMMERWKNAATIPELFAPAPNPFIPTMLDVLGEPLASGEQDLEGPQLIYSNELLEVHHKLDRTFQRPIVVSWMKLTSPLPYRSPAYCVLSTLFTCLLEDVLTEFTYPARCAGFHFWMAHDNYEIVLTFRGYTHRFDTFVKAILEKIVSFEAETTRFNMQKDSLQRYYKSVDKNQPYTRAMYNISHIMEEPHWHVKEYLEKLNDGSVTLEALNAFAKELIGRSFVTTLFHGNISAESAIGIGDSIQKIFAYKPVPESERLKKRLVQLPVEKTVFTRAQSPNVDDSNSAIEVFFPIALRGDFVTDIRLELLGEILNKPAFHELRTVQQLGYIVFEGDRDIEYLRGLFVIVQSTVADPDDLLDRIDSFLEKSREETLGTMTDDVFQQYLSSMVANKSEPDTSMVTRTCRFWSEIDSGLMRFDRRQREVEILRSTTKHDILQFFDTYIAPGGRKRRRIVGQIYGNQHPYEMRRQLEGPCLDVENPVAFKKQCALYPVENSGTD